MSAKVRIVIGAGDQVRVYLPSKQELTGFIPSGELVAQLRQTPEGYRVYDARAQRTDLHHDYPEALRAALRLDTASE